MEAKRFTFYNRDSNTLQVIGLVLLTDINRFSDEDIEEISVP